MDLHFGWGAFNLCGEMRLSLDQALLPECHDFIVEMLPYKYKHNINIPAVWCSLNALCPESNITDALATIILRHPMSFFCTDCTQKIAI